MLVLFDHGTPRGLARVLSGHTIDTAQARRWDTLSNGELLNAAEEAGFDLLVTTDRRIRYQQNLANGVSPSSSSRAAPGGLGFDDTLTVSPPLSRLPPLAVTPRSTFPSTETWLRFEWCLSGVIVAARCFPVGD